MTIRAGRLNRLIELQQKVSTPTGTGGRVTSWTTFARVWSQPRGLRGEERFQAQQMAASVDWEFTIRYRDDVKAADQRVKYGNTTAVIRSAFDPDGRRERVVILAQESPE